MVLDDKKYQLDELRNFKIFFLKCFTRNAVRIFINVVEFWRLQNYLFSEILDFVFSIIISDF